MIHYVSKALSLLILAGFLSQLEPTLCSAQSSLANIQWKKLDSSSEASFRGLAVVDQTTFWVSGSAGTVLRSVDGGQTIVDVSVANASERDFRDIHAFDADTAIVMNAGFPGEFYRTTDGGKNWTRVHHDTRKEIFFDAMDFWDDKNGIAFGDAIDGRLVLIRTSDGGKTWQNLEGDSRPRMGTGEAGFAASGSCLITFDKRSVMIATGGAEKDKHYKTCRLLVSHDRGDSWKSLEVPLRRNPSSGMFSICRMDKQRLVVVGGDYTKPNATADNCALSDDLGQSWLSISKQAPSGFRSAVIPIPGKFWLLTAGTNGIDGSNDHGKTWQKLSKLSINVIGISPDGKQIIAAGPKGQVVRGAWK